MRKDEARCWVGIDLGGTKMLAKVFDAKFDTLGRERKKTKGLEGVDSVVSRMVKAIQIAVENAEVDADSVAGIGVGVPGPVDQDRGIVHEAVNLSWENVPLGQLLNREFGCPIVICNDVDAGVYGEYRFGAARGARTVLGVFPGTGIGGGCVYEGQIVRGRGISCMEIGHVHVTPNGRLCGCGRRGCLETEASRLAISAEVAAAAYRGESSRIAELAGTDLANIRSGLLAQAIREGDTVVESIVERAAEQLGVAVSNFVHLMAPDTVVLGGGLAEAMPELFVNSVSRSANEHLMPSFVDTFKVVSAQLGDDASVLGVAAWAEKNAGQLSANES